MKKVENQRFGELQEQLVAVLEKSAGTMAPALEDAIRGALGMECSGEEAYQKALVEYLEQLQSNALLFPVKDCSQMTAKQFKAYRLTQAKNAITFQKNNGTANSLALAKARARHDVGVAVNLGKGGAFGGMSALTREVQLPMIKREICKPQSYPAQARMAVLYIGHGDADDRVQYDKDGNRINIQGLLSALEGEMPCRLDVSSILKNFDVAREQYIRTYGTQYWDLTKSQYLCDVLKGIARTCAEQKEACAEAIRQAYKTRKRIYQSLDAERDTERYSSEKDYSAGKKIARRMVVGDVNFQTEPTWEKEMWGDYSDPGILTPQLFSAMVGYAYYSAALKLVEVR